MSSMQHTDLAVPSAGIRPARHRGLVLTAATLGFGVVQLDVSVVNVAVKPIGAALGSGVTGLQWVVDAYTLTFAALILSAGALGDRRGHKLLLMAGFVVFTLASAACGLVPAISTLIAALAGATIEAGSAGVGSPLVYCGYVLAAAAGAAFITIEHARARPMLPLLLFRTRAFSTAACAGLLVNLVFFGLIFAFSLFLQRQQGLSPLSTGLAFLPVTVLIVVSNLVAGRAIPVRGTRPVAAAGALFMGAGCLAMLGLLAAHVTPLVPMLVAGLSLTGFGIGLVVTAITSALLGSVLPAQSGIASGTFTAFRQTGSVLGVALFGSLLASLHAAAGLEVTFAIAAGLIVIVAGLNLVKGP